ncbi:MAG: hypothetical protein ACJ8F7_04220 [Gemmataceae bacterium]
MPLDELFETRGPTRRRHKGCGIQPSKYRNVLHNALIAIFPNLQGTPRENSFFYIFCIRKRAPRKELWTDQCIIHAAALRFGAVMEAAAQRVADQQRAGQHGAAQGHAQQHCEVAAPVEMKVSQQQSGECHRKGFLLRIAQRQRET